MIDKQLTFVQRSLLSRYEGETKRLILIVSNYLPEDCYLVKWQSQASA